MGAEGTGKFLYLLFNFSVNLKRSRCSLLQTIGNTNVCVCESSLIGINNSDSSIYHLWLLFLPEWQSQVFETEATWLAKLKICLGLSGKSVVTLALDSSIIMKKGHHRERQK